MRGTAFAILTARNDELYGRDNTLLEPKENIVPPQVGEIFGDDMAATAMIDRLIHHSEILSLKGNSHRLRGMDLDTRVGPTLPVDALKRP